MVLTTDRLILRPITEQDAGDVFEYSSGANVGIHAGWKPHESIEETRAVMQVVFLNQENVFGIMLKGTDKLIGSIGLIKDPKRDNPNALMLGYAIGEAYWGKGYTTEAAQAVIGYGFDKLELELISAYCYPYNERSKRVLHKCGFVYEGTLRRSEIRFDGTVYDSECYSVMKP